MYATLQNSKKSERGVSHFVALLGIGRLLRMCFWSVVIVIQMQREDGMSHSGFMWTYVLPDTIHTLIIADYVYIWLKKVRRDEIEPFLQSTLGIKV